MMFAVGAKVKEGQDPVHAARTLQPSDLARDDLRGAEAAQFASQVATIADVRTALLEFQRQFATQEGGAVLDGRDIGTVICPNAHIKLFVTASPDVRARRRWAELGEAQPFDDILAAVKDRDERDMNRADAPLRPAQDAHLLDTSDMAIDEVLQHAIALVKNAQ